MLFKRTLPCCSYNDRRNSFLRKHSWFRPVEPGLLGLVARSRSNWVEGWGLDWVGRCAFDLGCGIGGNVMNDGKYKSGKKMHQLFPRPLSANTMRFPRQEVTIAHQTQFQASLSEQLQACRGRIDYGKPLLQSDMFSSAQNFHFQFARLYLLRSAIAFR